ncbi:MAG TPA: hypothetical protein VEY11_01625 [Pyrinomonadaceae bacterium]|nr:hypothetical protein [Pyrinomonadaceae bacterium]
MSDSHLLRLKYLLSLISLLFACTAQGQTNIEPARKFDEFGDVDASDIIARLDSLAIALQNEPHARAFIIVYRTRRDLPGLSNRYAHRMRGYLIESRGIEPRRVVTVDGGVASCLTQELWLVPVGATPQPRADVYSNHFAYEAYKFDEHYYARPNDPVEIGYWVDASTDLHVYLEAYALALQKEPRATAYLVAYTSAESDRAAFAAEMLRRERDFLIRQYGIKAARIKTVNGGRRKWRGMELWIVPPGEKMPFELQGRISPQRRRR